jgi:hypothetical protein
VRSVSDMRSLYATNTVARYTATANTTIAQHAKKVHFSSIMRVILSSETMLIFSDLGNEISQRSTNGTTLATSRYTATANRL